MEQLPQKSYDFLLGSGQFKVLIKCLSKCGCPGSVKNVMNKDLFKLFPGKFTETSQSLVALASKLIKLKTSKVRVGRFSIPSPLSVVTSFSVKILFKSLTV